MEDFPILCGGAALASLMAQYREKFDYKFFII
jgi:hypothetical protein